jgi:hypothetical protein
VNVPDMIFLSGGYHIIASAHNIVSVFAAKR